MPWPLATEPLSWLGILVFVIFALLVIGLCIAFTFGPIALLIAGIVKSLRNSGSSTVMPPSGNTFVASGPGQRFAQAFAATLQQSLGQQLGQQLGQVLEQAAAQHPLTIQLAPIVLAIDSARRQGDLAPVRRFVTGRFAEHFGTSVPPTPGPGRISRMTVQGDEKAAHADHAVISVTRANGLAIQDEYWNFVRDAAAAPEGMPTQCPHCAAPTAGNQSGACRFCGFSFFTSGPVLPAPTRWLLDDITNTPPAVAA